MQINMASQFNQVFCVEWRRSYFMGVHAIQMQFLELTGPIPSQNTILNYIQDIIRESHTSEQNRRIQRLLDSGLRLSMRLFRSTAYMKMISGTLIKQALQWGSIHHQKSLLQWIAVKVLIQLSREIANGLQSLNAQVPEGFLYHQW